MNKIRNRLLFLLIALALAACYVPPSPTPTISPFASPLPAPLATLPSHSKLCVMIGNRPNGLSEFLQTTQCRVVYSLNNSAMVAIRAASPDTLLVRRIQNDVWDRLPDQMYAGLGTAHQDADARASAHYEALQKTIRVPWLGHLNYVQFAMLSDQTWLAPMNEPVIGQGPDRFDRARWLDVWFTEWLTIIHQYGLHGSIFSFPTGEPMIDTVSLLAPAACLAAANGDIVDLHEYGIEGALQTSPSSGALRYRQFYAALPDGCRPQLVISEFSSGNGYNTGLAGTPWINDTLWYGRQIANDPRVIGAAAFQSDSGAESNIPPDVLQNYANAAMTIDWGRPYVIWLPGVWR